MSLADFVSHPRVTRWLPTTLNGGMLLLLVASLAQWTWQLVKPPLPPPAVAPPPAAAPASTFSVQPLLAAHLFGQAAEELNGRRPEGLPLSRLNLALTGVVLSAPGGYALISVNGREQEPYAVGQSVTEGTLLEAVYPERAVIRRNGALESLVLKEIDSMPVQIATAPVMTAPATNPSSVPSAPMSASAAVSGSPAESEEPIYIAPTDQTAARINPPHLMKQATLMPAREGGVTVRLIQPGSLYEKLKMRSGDVIKSINGQQINSPQDAFRLYQQLPQTGPVQIEVVRGGRSQFLTHQ